MRNVDSSPRVDKDALAFQFLAVDLETMRSDESGLSAIQVQILALFYLSLLSRTPLADNVVLSGNDAGQVNTYVASAHSPFAGVTCIVGYLGTRDHGFRRCAPRVDARSAQVFFLDQRHRPPLVGQLLRKRVAGLSGTNHDRIVPRHGGSLLPLNALQPWMPLGRNGSSLHSVLKQAGV